MVSKAPKWADSIEELRSYIADAQIKAINQPSTSGTGSGIHIGIFDSHYELPSSFVEEYSINQGLDNSFVPNPESNTNPHGIVVFDQLSAVAPNAEFSVYQAINQDGDLVLGAYADAISKAIDDGVDIINLSAGDPWPALIDINPNVLETKRLIERNIPVVAAAGNYKPKHDSRPPVHCPSAAEGVISVGGYITECPCEPGEESEESKEGPYYYQFDVSNSKNIENPAIGTYCSEQGCVKGESCITRQSESPWDRNPMPSGDKPDVLAPMHIVRNDEEDGYFIDSGTSFAAPLVTGALACIFSELQNLGKDTPTSYEAQNAVRNGASRLKNSQIGKFDAMGTRSVLDIG